jgi:hypothetical protein
VTHLTAEAKLGAEVLGYPTAGCFAKRGCKRLKTKDGCRKKRTKRLQAIEKSMVSAGVAAPINEVCSR